MKNLMDTSREEGKIEVARALVAVGDANDKIARVTGLSIEEIEKLRV